VTVQLLFDVNDVGDSIFTTMVLIDNIRFSTVWLDVKTINGASSQGLADLNARVQRDVRQANEVLSQAGINVRLRGVQSVANASLLDIGIKAPHPLGTPGTCSNPNGSIVLGADGVALTNKQLITQVTAPNLALETTLLNTDRSGTVDGAPGGTATDVNVYYVQSALDADTGAGLNVLGWSANQGDFCQKVSIPADVNFGTLVTDIASMQTLTHELGHQLITAISDLPGTLLHACTSSAGTCFTVPGAPPTAIVTSTQSQVINGSPLLRP
jgi:hypothetical protein